ncbi:hypothetical protein [Aureispira sp. CCB-QB1]|uniref:rolling circle replication-associated protein n=1 Tax=Aureispira sp. CCB-QB1 TaxID=1313421 RepID=UPI000698288D|nr:hypothetical protein [Aureispira sp. CCB-QB1]
MKLKKSYTTQEIAELLGICKKTIARRRKKIANDKMKSDWVKKKGTKYYHKKQFLTEFIPEKILSSNEEDLELELKRIKTYVNKLKNPNDLATFLSYLDWSYFCTVSYEKDLSPEHCRSNMDKLFDELRKQYPKKSLRILFSTEPFKKRGGGFHNHIALFGSLENETIQSILDNQFPHAINHVEDYRNSMAGMNYILKDWNKMDGLYWGIRGTDLERDGERVHKILECA